MAKLRQAHDISIPSSACELKVLELSYLNSFKALFPPWFSFNFIAWALKLSGHLKRNEKKKKIGHKITKQPNGTRKQCKNHYIRAGGVVFSWDIIHVFYNLLFCYIGKHLKWFFYCLKIIVKSTLYAPQPQSDS